MSGHYLVLSLFLTVFSPAVLFSFDCDPDSVTAEVSGGSVFVYHWNAEYNCCPMLEFAMEEEDTVIHIMERDTTNMPCSCVCCFDLTILLKGLLPGTYRIMVWNWDRTELFGWTRITIGGSGEGAYLAGASRSDCKELGINGEPELAPEPGFEILQNYPNPFNPATTIEITIPEGDAEKTALVIYDLRGRRIRTLIDENLEPGIYSIAWDGRDDGGREVPSGAYLCRLTHRDHAHTKKMDLIK